MSAERGEARRAAERRCAEAQKIAGEHYSLANVYREGELPHSAAKVQDQAAWWFNLSWGILARLIGARA